MKTQQSGAFPLCAALLAALACGCTTEIHEDRGWYGFEGGPPGATTSTEGHIRKLRERLDKMPARNDLRERLAHAYHADEQYDRAIATFQEAIASDPRNGKLHFLLGEIYSEMHRYAEAERSFRQAVTYSRAGFTGLHLALAFALAMQDKHQDAVDELMVVLKVEPEQPTACYYLASCYDAMGRSAEALEYFDRCARFESPYQAKARMEGARLRRMQAAAAGATTARSGAGVP